MRSRRLCAMMAMVAVLMAGHSMVSAQTPMGTAFKYQGRLTDGGSPANGLYDFEFTLYDSMGFPAGSPTLVNDHDVSNGLFSATLDFGSTPFQGGAMFLEIAVRPGPSSDPYTTLSPRQELTPTPYALYALNAPSSSGLTLPYQGTLTGQEEGTHALDIENDAPESSTIRGVASGSDGKGVFGSSSGTYGYGVRGGATGDGGVGVYGSAYTDALTAIYGRAAGTPPQGEHNTGGHFLAFGSNSVGVYGEAERGVLGVSSNGTGVRGETDASGGYGVAGINNATTGNAIAVYGATGTASGFGGYFVGRGYFSNNVGIGMATPNSPLTVAGIIESLSGGFKFPDGTIQTTAGGGGSLWQQNGNEIYYDTDNVGIGVTDPQATLHVAGGNWDVASTEGDFKIGSSVYRLKMGVATSGGGAGTCRIYAGGPSSQLILGVSGQERVTITDSLTDVTGTLEMDGFTLTSAPTAGHVLTSDANGVGTWQEPTGGGGFTLPYDGAVLSSSTAFGILNMGTGLAMAGWSSGNGASFRSGMTDGYGVKGEAIAASGSDTVGGWFESSSSTGKGVYGLATGYYATGILAKATGAEATALTASASGASGIGIVAKNESTTQAALVAKNYVGGPLIQAKNAVANMVFEVANDGTTTVKELHITGGADLAEHFDVTEPSAEPGTVVEIDPDHPGKLRIARGAYNRRVAGVISGANELGVGMILADMPGAGNAMPIALSGRVWVHCDAMQQAIQPGDMLTTAARAGHAMAVTDFPRAHGTVIGKAMTELTRGETGMVLVLVNLQ